MGCGCAACRGTNSAQNGASAISGDYVGTGTATQTEANSLFSGYKWGTTSLTYKFLTSLPGYYSPSDDEANNLQGFNAQMKSSVGRILGQLESFTNLHFTETADTNAAKLTYAQATLPTGVGAWAYYPSASSYGGDVWTNNYYAATQNPAEGNYGFYTLMHETGHALGLQHSFTAGLTGDENTSRYTVMAYDWSPFYASTYMVYDIAALQSMYGANMNYRTGADNYILDGTKAYTVWDAGGTDTFDASAYNSAVTLDLRDGEYSSVGMTRNIGIALNAVIENANGGSGNDKLIGNEANNILLGNNGNDIFISSEGNDTVNGGNGTDLLVYDIDISNFLISLVDSITLLLQDITGRYDTDTVIAIENFEFQNADYTFSDLSTIAASGGSVTLLENIGIRLLTANGRWTAFNSRFEGVLTHHADEFAYSGSSDFVTISREIVTGSDSLDILVDSAYLHTVRALTLSGMTGLDDLGINGIRSVSLNFRNMDHVFSMTLDNVLYSRLYTGTQDDTIAIDTGLVDPLATQHYIFSGDGNDSITMTSGSALSFAYIVTGNGDDDVDLHAFDGLLTRVVAGAGDDEISTGSSIDFVYGQDGNDVIHGGSGNDRLYGQNGNDTLDGGAGNDRLYGHNGNDILNGGDGYDILVGGGGADVFVFDNQNDVDRVADFRASQDSLDLSALLSGFDPVTDAIADFLHVTTVSNRTFLQIDTNGAAGGSNFVDLAQINGLRNVDLDDLLNNGQILHA